MPARRSKARRVEEILKERGTLDDCIHSTEKRNRSGRSSAFASYGRDKSTIATGIAKRCQKLLGNGSGFAIPDLTIVDGDDCQHLARGAGEESFVGGEEIVVAQHLFANFDAGIAAELEDELASDAGQQSGFERRCKR